MSAILVRLGGSVARLVIASCLALASAIGSTAWRVDVVRQSRALELDLEATKQALASTNTTAPTALKVDFAHGLSDAPAVDPVVRELQRASTEAGAAFVALTATPRPATLQALGRIELAVSLRGAYPKLKSILAQTLDRFPGLIVQRLTIRRLSTPLELEAHVDLMLLTRPLLAAGTGS